MALSFKIGVSAPTYGALKKLAALTNEPENLGAVVSKLVDYWHNGTPTQPDVDMAAQVSEPKLPTQLWRSPRGDFFPIGLALRAVYLGTTYGAKVSNGGIEFAGKTYDSLSAAAIAVKAAAGKSGAGANTNGWEFWEMFEVVTGQWEPISKLKAAKK